jgi:hypothetical protein
MKSARITWALRLAAVSALLALVLMVWGVLDPHPISLVIAMSVGQALGTASFVVFLGVVFADLWTANVFSNVVRRFSDKPARAPDEQ